MLRMCGEAEQEMGRVGSELAALRRAGAQCKSRQAFRDLSSRLEASCLRLLRNFWHFVEFWKLLIIFKTYFLMFFRRLSARSASAKLPGSTKRSSEPRVCKHAKHK